MVPVSRSFAESEIKEYRLAAKLAVVNLTGNGHPDTAVWAYDGTVPGSEIRVRQGLRLSEGLTILGINIAAIRPALRRCRRWS